MADVAAAAALTLVVLSVLLVGRGHPLQNLNEGLYARVAQEMLERRDFIVPRLDGVPYLEKPPLLYWLTAAAFAALGQGEAVARLAPLLGAVVMVSAAAWFARRHLAPQGAWLAVPMLASAPIVLVMVRTLMFDLLFTGLLFAALVFLFDAFEDAGTKRWLRASYALLALAVLAKGFAALVFYGIVATVPILSKARGTRVAAARRFAEPGALALLIGIALPWHLLAARAQAGFAWFYFVNEHVLRFLGERTPHDYHGGPWWYYLPRVAVDLFPWTLLLVLPAARASCPAERLARRFLWAAFLVPLAVFSVSEGKGEYYMIVGAPPLVLLAADRLARAPSPRAATALLSLGLLVVASLATLLGPPRCAAYALPVGLRDQLMLAALLVAIGLVAASGGWRKATVLACAALAIPCAAAYSDFFRANEGIKSARSLALQLERSKAPVYVYRGFEAVSALPFYLDSPLGVVDYRGGDLSYGAQLDRQRDRFLDASSLAARATAEPMWLVVPRGQQGPFAQSPLAKAFVAEGSAGTTRIYASQPLAEKLACGRLLAAPDVSSRRGSAGASSGQPSPGEPQSVGVLAAGAAIR
jgi:4-amino-4-deoxy-L-arabinose transferase-like glycosyltransferase